MSPFKVLVTGGSGLLGRALMDKLHTSTSWQVRGTAYSRKGPDLIQVDLKDEQHLAELLADYQPDVVINSVAERRPDVAETDTIGTQLLNVELPRRLAAWACAEPKAVTLIHISTDYVFDGRDPPYDVHDTPNPLNFYGNASMVYRVEALGHYCIDSKLEGEQALLATYPNAIVLRVPVLYGRVEFNAESAVNVLVDVVQNSEKVVSMDDFSARYPTNVADVARVCRDMVKRALEAPTSALHGVFHYSAPERFTKYQMCRKFASVELAVVSTMPNPLELAAMDECFAEILELSTDHIHPVSKAPEDAQATRPIDCQFATHALAQAGIDCGVGQPFKAWWRAYLQ
ncbi:hypothetical protein H4R34_001414 [Dimargaris verticillata]|uniref:RmlD-like substrate binding domain-containing protein n=1 Tax=Dimargaris verticillata TaxID=2761393 RepID=A0A9W8B5I9_9FUNG|nr:hypothetical protein H4R34_001414 [Dimargaris verticillata]